MGGRVGGVVGLLVTVLSLVLSTGGPPAAQALDGTEDDLGARSFYEGSWSTPVLGPGDLTRFGPVYPQTPPMDELYEVPRYYGDGCHAGRARTLVVPGCVYGAKDGSVRVAVVGNSKIGQYFPALEEIALREGWTLRMYTKSACDFVKDAPPTPNYPECDSYNTALREHLEANPPDLVLTGGMRTGVAEGYASAWTFLEGLGAEQIAAVWDTPVPVPTPRFCIADALEAGTDLTECAVPLSPDRSGNLSMKAAAQDVEAATFIDLRDWVCPESDLSPLCAAVVGRAQIYSDGSHLAQGFAATLTDPLHQRLHEAGIARYRPSVDRVAGGDRYATAALLTRDVEVGGRVLVASGVDYPDALAAAAKAGHTDGAVLLTRPTSLPGATRAALLRLQPSQIVVAGGPSAVSEDVVRDLRTFSPSVRRVAGGDRYETAAEISGLAPVSTRGVVYVATGTGYADALAAAAQAGQREAAILLVRPERIPAATAQALRDLQPRRIVVAGGSGAVSDDVLDDLRDFASVGVERRAGTDRYGTAVELARTVAPGRVLHVGVGTTFADSLAAAPAASARHGAVLLVAPDRVPSTTAQALGDLGPRQLLLTGGTGAVSDDVRRDLLRLVP